MAGPATDSQWIQEKIASLPTGKRASIQGHVVDHVPSKGYRVRLRGQGSRHYKDPQTAAMAVIAGRHMTVTQDKPVSRQLASVATGAGDVSQQNGRERTPGTGYGRLTASGVLPASQSYSPDMTNAELEAAIRRARAINSPMLSMYIKILETRQRQSRLGPQPRHRR